MQGGNITTAHRVFTTLILAVWILFGSVPEAGAAQPAPLPTDALARLAQTNGSVRLIVRLKMDYQPEGLLDGPRAVVDQRAAIRDQQTALLARIDDRLVTPARRYDYIPYLALTVDEAGLALLRSLPEVESIEEDVADPVALADSVTLIGATPAQTGGYTGAGQTIAILDTGVDKTHPFLAGKVVSEACYSYTSAIDSSTTVCPDGTFESIAPGSGVQCPLTGCDHGTHVAGIAAGKGDSFSGVARDATIIAIQVFSRFNSEAQCGTGNAPCVRTFRSDQLLGLQRVYALRSQYNIAAVNMSLGSGSNATACDSDSRKMYIEALRAVGIATVISSGNDYSTTGISAPACISSAVSVGSTRDGGLGATPADAVSSFSNSAGILNLLAPGQVITSSIPGGGYAGFNGTSMAAPHVAGAWAVLKSKNPAATVDQVLAALTNSGVPVTDLRNGIVKPRIRVDAALQLLAAPPLPTIGFSTPYFTVNENSITASVTVSLSATSGTPVTVSYATSPQTAASGIDYAPANGTLTFPPAALTQTITIPILDDLTDGPDKTVMLTLSNASGAALSQAVALLTIVDDDAPPALQWETASTAVSEGEGLASIPVRLSAASEYTVTVRYATVDGTALAGEDYTAASGTLTFPPSEVALEQTVSIPTAENAVDDENRTFYLRLSNPQNATIPAGQEQSAVTILDDEGLPTVFFSDSSYQASETDGTAVVKLVLSHPSTQEVAVSCRTTGGSAAPGSDFTIGSGPITFQPGVTTQDLNITIIADTLAEPDETIELELYDPQNAILIQPPTMTVTIVDPPFRQLYLPILVSK